MAGVRVAVVGATGAAGRMTLRILGDQLRKGAATNAVQIAELLIDSPRA